MSKPITYEFRYNEVFEDFDLFINGEFDQVMTDTRAERFAARVSEFHGTRNQPYYIIWA